MEEKGKRRAGGGGERESWHVPSAYSVLESILNTINVLPYLTLITILGGYSYLNIQFSEEKVEFREVK